MPHGINKKALALLGLGHLMVDLNTGALPALLPFLKNSFALSYTMTSALILVANVSSSLVQPVFGYLSDRSAKAWLLPCGVIAATCGMASVGLAGSYPALLALVLISGIGIASYHPEAYKTAYLSTGAKKATGISLFSVGGNNRSRLRPAGCGPVSRRLGTPRPAAAVDTGADRRRRVHPLSTVAVAGSAAIARGAERGTGYSTCGYGGGVRRGHAWGVRPRRAFHLCAAVF